MCFVSRNIKGLLCLLQCVDQTAENKARCPARRQGGWYSCLARNDGSWPGRRQGIGREIEGGFGTLFVEGADG